MRCKHKRTHAYVWRIGGGGVPNWFMCASFETPDNVTCLDCGVSLPLGPSNDADPRVALEIRAAIVAEEFAKTDDSDLLARTSINERRGWWMSAANDKCGEFFWWPESSEGQVGYLAREIHQHDARTITETP